MCRGIRDDIEQEDDEESYYRYVEENPELFQEKEESDQEVEYDEEGNPIWTKSKYIDPLPPIDHSTITYPPFEKNFYLEHADIQKLTEMEVNALTETLGLKVTGPSPPKPVSSFGHFGFDDNLLKVIRKSDYIQPTPIQAQGIPIALSGRDMIGIAKTGSGKTAAFLWPMLVHVMDQPELKEGDGPIGLILAPTRELAQQIYLEAKKFGKVYGLRVVCAYGGGSKWDQCKALQEGAEILVATPVGINTTWRIRNKWLGEIAENAVCRAEPLTSSRPKPPTCRGSPCWYWMKPTECSTWGLVSTAASMAEMCCSDGGCCRAASQVYLQPREARQTESCLVHLMQAKMCSGAAVQSWVHSNVPMCGAALMFSATFKRKVERLARDAMQDPVRVVQGVLGEANQDVTQHMVVINPQLKMTWLLSHLVDFTSQGSVLLFVTKKVNSEEMANQLKLNDFQDVSNTVTEMSPTCIDVLLLPYVSPTHGMLWQWGCSMGTWTRMKGLRSLRPSRRKNFPSWWPLMSPDVCDMSTELCIPAEGPFLNVNYGTILCGLWNAARGLDIPHIKTVVNYDMARDVDTHTHRVGRTGRAGETGTAYTLVTERDKEFAGHLVRNLEGANQPVPSELMELAMQASWFRKSRFKQGQGRPATGLGYRERPGLGASTSSHSRYEPPRPILPPNVVPSTGPQSNRLASMKKAFT
ncbi:DDX42, partial [Cordylochernes scorpioides]